ncbi:putative oligopeptidase B [Dioscorea sansibarensis]
MLSSSTLQKPSLFSFLFARLLPSLFFSSSFSSCKRRTSSPFKPPVPKKIASTISVHGSSWDDPFHWMCNTSDPDLLRYLHQENSYAQAFMADTQELQRTLFEEMKNRMPPKISTRPERWGKWLYYQHVPEGKEYPVLCRKLSCHEDFFGAFLNYMKGPQEETLLDWNEIAELYGYVNIGTCRISPDHNFLAYTLDTRGSELFVLQLKDLRTGSMILGSEVEGVLSLAWASASDYLFYTLCDENQRPNRVFGRKLGADVADDLLFTENDLSCCVDITSTKDGKFITVNSNSRTSSEEANYKFGLMPVRKRVPGVQYFLEHHYGFFYILTNDPSENITFTAEGYHLVRCRAEKSSLSTWQDVVLPGPDVTFQDMDMFNGHLVLSLEKEGVPMLCSINMPVNVDNEQAKYIEDLNPWFFPLPSASCSFLPASNHDFASSVFRLVVSSPMVPDLIVDYDMINQKFTILHQEEVIGLTASANPSRIQSNVELHLEKLETSQQWTDLSETYSCERRSVISHDGVVIPLTILYSRKVHSSGNSPGLIYGYGAYGEVLDKVWSADHISLLDRGWVIAYADVRGGGDRAWHQAGIKMNKPNSFHDFAACAIYLISEGYVHKNQLVAIGCSAGGLLVGATINMYPDLFCAAVLKVPFLDISNTMLDPSLPLTILDYDEFGDPNVQEEFETIHSYSPYDNIVPGFCYPSTLVTASFHDSRVGVWEAAKWVAKVREKTCPTCSPSVILKTNMNGGHFSEGGRLKHCEDTAFEYAFLIKATRFLNDAKQ